MLQVPTPLVVLKAANVDDDDDDDDDDNDDDDDDSGVDGDP